ncbi:MAG: hypothetical protein ACMVO3_22640 [Thalassobaculum sp.]
MISLGQYSPTTEVSQEVLGTSVSLVGKTALTVMAIANGLASGTKSVVYFQGAAGNVWYDLGSLSFTTGSGTKDLTIAAQAVSSPNSRVSAAVSDDIAVQGWVPDQVRAIITTTGTYTAGSVTAYYKAY